MEISWNELSTMFSYSRNDRFDEALKLVCLFSLYIQNKLKTEPIRTSRNQIKHTEIPMEIALRDKNKRHTTILYSFFV